MNTVIIGAAKGLGLCITKLLLEHGFTVAAGTLSMTPELITLKEKYSETLYVFNADITNETQIQESAKTCSKYLGIIDSVCIVAGILVNSDREKSLHLCDIDDLKKTFDVNFFGPVSVVKAYYPYLKEGANVFIVTSEGAGILNCGSWIPCYGLSKSAATKACGIFNQSVQNVNFYAVHPGRMNTDMGKTTAQIEPEVSAKGFFNLISGGIPLSRDNWYIDYLGNRMS